MKSVDKLIKTLCEFYCLDNKKGIIIFILYFLVLWTLSYLQLYYLAKAIGLLK
jgi:hypothetical protein